MCMFQFALGLLFSIIFRDANAVDWLHPPEVHTENKNKKEKMFSHNL